MHIMIVRTLVVIDPGVTTGIAVFTKVNRWEISQTFTITGGHLPQFIKDIPNVCVIMEHVIARNKSFNKQAIDNFECFKLQCDKWEVPYILQLPSLMTGAKRYAKAFLKTLPTEHERDAVCHGLAFLTSKDINATHIYKQD